MIFNRNSSGLGQYNASNIVPDESYYGESGALRITLEALQNDQAIFEALMAQDFDEMYSMQEGSLNESQIEALQEGAIGDFVNKIKEIVRKIAEKIKGLFHSFMVKVNSVIIRDNKKFVEKYRRDVLSKDLSKMKYKWSKPNDNAELKLTDSISEIEKCITLVKGATDTAALGKVEDQLTEGEFADAFLKRMLGGSSSTDEESFSKDAHELYYQDESEEEGMSAALLSTIMSNLINSKDALKDVEKTQKDADKAFTKYLSMIDKHVNGMSKSIPNNKDNSNDYGEDSTGGKKINISPNDQAGHKRSMEYAKGDTDGKQIIMKQLVMIQKTVTKTQGLFAKAAGVAITETKFGLAQDRRLFAKAASHNPKAVKESALFEAYAEEAAVYDVMSSLEAPGMN